MGKIDKKEKSLKAKKILIIVKEKYELSIEIGKQAML